MEPAKHLRFVRDARVQTRESRPLTNQGQRMKRLDVIGPAESEHASNPTPFKLTFCRGWQDILGLAFADFTANKHPFMQISQPLLAVAKRGQPATRLHAVDGKTNRRINARAEPVADTSFKSLQHACIAPSEED